MKRIICVVALAVLLSSCAVTDRRNKLAVAALTGLIAGGFVGYQVFGPGNEGVLGGFAIGGASAAFGYFMADTLLPRERQSFQRVTYQTLQESPEGQVTTWESSDSKATADITPIRSFKDKGGRLCREFVIAFTYQNSNETVNRTACRGYDGSWITV